MVAFSSLFLLKSPPPQKKASKTKCNKSFPIGGAPMPRIGAEDEGSRGKLNLTLMKVRRENVEQETTRNNLELEFTAESCCFGVSLNLILFFFLLNHTPPRSPSMSPRCPLPGFIFLFICVLYATDMTECREPKGRQVVDLHPPGGGPPTFPLFQLPAPPKMMNFYAQQKGREGKEEKHGSKIKESTTKKFCIDCQAITLATQHKSFISHSWSFSIQNLYKLNLNIKKRETARGRGKGKWIEESKV